MDEFNTLRQAVLDGFGKLTRIFGKTFPKHLCWTEPDGSPIAGTLFDSLAILDESVVLLAENGTCAIPLESVPTSRLIGILWWCIIEEMQSLVRAERTANVDFRELLREKRRILQAILLGFTPLNPRYAAGRQVCESLLALGGPWGDDDLYDDGCGDLLLNQPGVRPDDLPYVVILDAGKKRSRTKIRRIGRLSWTAEWQRLFVTLHAEDEKEEFFFEVYPDGSVCARPADPSPRRSAADNRYPVELPTESLQRLERLLINEQSCKEIERKVRKAESREVQPLGTFWFLALKALLAKKGHRLRNGDRAVYFDRSSYEYVADIPHARTWWGGIAAIAEIRLSKDDALEMLTYGVLGKESSRIYNGFEEEKWDFIFSQAYTELQAADDPDWEDWAKEFRRHLWDTYDEGGRDAAVLRAVQDAEKDKDDGQAPGYLLGNEGVPIRSLPGNAHLLSVTISDGSDDYPGIPAGKPAYGIDDGGHLYVSDGRDIALADIICALNLSF